MRNNGHKRLLFMNQQKIPIPHILWKLLIAVALNYRSILYIKSATTNDHISHDYKKKKGASVHSHFFWEYEILEERTITEKNRPPTKKKSKDEIISQSLLFTPVSSDRYSILG